MPIRSIVDPADGGQTLTVGSGVRIIQGTGNAETINVLDGTEVEARTARPC